MIITQIPSGLCFEKNIPDIILQKENNETKVDFVLSIGQIEIINESYFYDANGFVYIRNIDQIISPHLEAIQEIVSGYIITTGLVQLFNFRLNGNEFYYFEVIRSEADMGNTSPAEYAAANFFNANGFKRTSVKRNEYLTYLHTPDMGNVLIKYKLVKFSNSQIQEISGQFVTVTPGEFYRFITLNVSLEKILESAGQTVDNLLYYDVWFYDVVADANSNTFRFLIDKTPYRQEVNFVFVNSFGCFDTFTATGRSTIKKNLDLTISKIFGKIRKTDQEFLPETTINSGYLSKAEMEWIDELLLSFNVGLYLPGETTYEDITIISSDKSDSTVNALDWFEFTFRRSAAAQFKKSGTGVFDITFDNTFN